MRNHLTTDVEVTDIPLDAPYVSKTTLPFPFLSVNEIRISTLKSGNTALGPDEIPSLILRNAWLLIEVHF